MGTFINVVDSKSAADKEIDFFKPENRFISSEKEFESIPNKIYAYEVSKKTAECFELEALSNHFITREGMATAANDIFLKMWFEVVRDKITFSCDSEEDAMNKKVKWVPYNKGGGTRDWYGNNDYVVDWSNNGYSIKHNIDPITGRIRSHNYNGEYGFLEGLTWSAISSGNLSVRYCEKGFLFDSKGAKGFPCNDADIYWILGLLNSKVAMQFLSFISPTLDFKVGDIILIPYKCDDSIKNEVITLSKNMVSRSKYDWNMFETSWEFQTHVLLGKGLLSDIFIQYSETLEENFRAQKNDEEKLNKLLINSYSLQSEIDDEIEEKDIDIKKSDMGRDVKSLISYAVGCVMGRYSLKENGLIYAGGEWDEFKYLDNFKPCEYGIIPITEKQYFGEDLCTRVIDFIKVVYGEGTLNENLKFIANALKPYSYESPKKIIRDYLFNGFFDNHYQIYQHRPIYWQLDSGKSGGFRAIMYMHRFNENTLSAVRTEFIQELRYKYEDEIQRLQHKLGDAKTTAEKNDVKKQATAIDKKLVECTVYDDLLNHVTGSIQNYMFDLDDGVKTNYAKFLSIDGDKTKNVLTVIKL